MNDAYVEYRRRLMHRHENAMTSGLSTVGDVVMVSGLAFGLVARRPRTAAVGVALGLGVAAFAHLFQPGTLVEEIGSIMRHPLWALRAETQRITGRAA